MFYVRQQGFVVQKKVRQACRRSSITLPPSLLLQTCSKNHLGENNHHPGWGDQGGNSQ
jgi:hypothetical protein